MDILRTDSPVMGFDFPSLTPLTRPSPSWIRALSSAAPLPASTEDSEELGWEAAAEIHSLAHHLSFPIAFDSKRTTKRASADSLGSVSSRDSGSTVCYTSSTSTLHTPTSSMDYNFNPRSLAKSRSLASLSLAPSAQRAAVYILDDYDDMDDALHEQDVRELESPQDCFDEPPSRFSFDEEERPPRPLSTNIREIWSRSRAVSVSSPRVPPMPSTPQGGFTFPKMETTPTSPPPSPAAHKKTKRKTTLSVISSVLHSAVFGV